MSTIDAKDILKILGAILLVISVFFIVCIPVALYYSEPITPFIYSFIITIIPGVILYFIIRHPINTAISAREGYLSVTLSWIILTLSGLLPYFISGASTDFVRTYFESVSGFTTTGSTIFPDVESMPRSILFWRSMTHWIGGVGIILLAIIILPALKVGGYGLFVMESSVKQKAMPRTRSFALILLGVYTGLTVTEILLLVIGGMSLFESVCISFGTVATGGFSIRNTSLVSCTSYEQYIVAVFMFLSAISYVLYYYLLKKDFRRIRENEELRFYVLFTALSVAFITIVLFLFTNRDLSTSIRHSFFQVIAQITTTGFATTDYMKWPPIGWFFMFLLLFAGGSTGSSTGGIKMARHVIILKNLKSSFLKLQHPNAIFHIKFNGRIIPENINALMILFVILYLIIFVCGTIVIALTGIPINEAAGASATAMSNVGPGLGLSGNMGNFAHFNDFALMAMSFLMLIGRLEVFTILAIFTKPFWER